MSETSTEKLIASDPSISAAWMLARREWIRFFRQPNRIISAVAQPLLFWLLFGAGLNDSFRWAEGEGFLKYFLPGTIALVVLFTAIFTTISVIEDRREGFLQGVLVAPVRRWSILFGKIVGGGAIAWFQAIAFLGLALLVGTVPWSWHLLPAVGMLAVLAAALVALGMVIAWPMESTQGFHAVMTILLMPLWLLSGAFFPVPKISADAIGSVGLNLIMRLNPLSYSMVELRRCMFPEVNYAAAGWAPSSIVCWSVSISFMVAMLILAAWVMNRRTKADVQI